ncbi:ABC transporter ATP-binding protein [Anaeroselena agilis]|uniref:ABC transporter ATP-binding protein n=1 Tax=Anaeroselena agilis TaxID=3063788 RepID=A0ABU3NU59_9FIRM|nr:ABC transporter ATP-binding protein [Selenomonadales bacterium 4137-cl]
MLDIQTLCLRAGSFEAKQISFSVPVGGCHALVGATGSGKTLVLETIAGLRKAQSGRIYWFGQDITTLPPEQRKLAYVPQDLALFPHMTVRENIEYGLRMQKNLSSGKHAEIDKLAHSLGISHLLDRSTKNLSGGERQRTALSRALAPGNKLLLLDEPFSALHEAMRRELWLLLKTLQQQYGITILIVTHDMEEAFFLADSVTFISRGSVVQSGNKHHVYQCPKNTEAAKFFGVQNLFSAEVVDLMADKVKLFCPSLGTTLHVTNTSSEQLQKKSAVTVGIRAENIVLKAESSVDESDHLVGANQFFCTVKHIYQKRKGKILLLQPSKGTKMEILLEADIAGDSFGKIPAFFVGQELLISLPAEQLFLFVD